MAELKRVPSSGKQNRDFSPYVLPPDQYRSLMNGRIARSEGSDVGALENVRGNTDLSTFQAPAIVIGSIRDQQRDRIYYFIVGLREDGIYEYNELTDRSRIILRSTSQSGVLKLSVDNLITGVNLIGEGENRLLYWTDGLNPPRRINIERMVTRHQQQLDGVVVDAITGERVISGFTEEEISVVKMPPLFPPNLIFTELDDLDASNDDETELMREQNLKEKFVRFAYRYKFIDDEYSAFSPFSDIAFSAGRFNFNRDTGQIMSMENIVREIDISFNTGPRDVLEIDLLYKTSDSPAVYVVESYIKDEEEWPDNTELGDTIINTFREELPTRVYTLTDRPLSVRRVLVSSPGGDPVEVRSSEYSVIVNADGTGTLEFPADNFANAEVTIEYTNIPEVKFSSRIPYRLLPESELLRVSDIVPLTAKSQDIIENRLVYGNYITNYNLVDLRSTFVLPEGTTSHVFDSSAEFPITVDLTASIARNRNKAADEDVDPDIIGSTGEGNLKTDRDYEIGIVYSDNVGRSTPVLTSDGNSIHLPLARANRRNKLQVEIGSVAPHWASTYRFFIKNTAETHYSILPIGPPQQDPDNNYVWFPLSPTDLDKVNVGEFLLLKVKEGLSMATTGERLSLRVEEIGVQERNFLEVNPPFIDPDDTESGVTTEQFPGIWMKVSNLGGIASNDLETGQRTTIAGASRARSNNSGHGGPIKRATLITQTFLGRTTDVSVLDARNDIELTETRLEETYYYASRSTTDETTGEEDTVNFTGTYAPGTPGTQGGEGSGPMRIEITMLSDTMFDWAYWINTGPNRRDDVERFQGDTNVTFIVDTPEVLGNGISVTFTSGNYSIGDRFVVTARRSFNPFWRYDRQSPLAIGKRDFNGRKGIAVIPRDRDVVAGGSTISIEAVDDRNITIAGFSTKADGPFLNLQADDNTFDTGNTPYETLEEWMFENDLWRATGGADDDRITGTSVGGLPAGIKNFGFWRGDLISSSNTSRFTDRRLLSNEFKIRDNPDGVLRFLIASESRNPFGDRDSGNTKIRCDYREKVGLITSPELEQAFLPNIFETIPAESALDIYYEVGDTYKCINGVHYSDDPNNYQLLNTVPMDAAGVETGEIERSVAITLDYFNCIAWNNGVEVMTIRDEFGVAEIDKGAKASITIDEYQEVNNFASLIYSGPFNETIGINRLNVFSSNDVGNRTIVKELDDADGSVQKIYAENTDLIVFQEDKISRVQVDKNALFNADGSSNVSASSSFLNQTIPYPGEWGISQNPESFAVYGNSKFFADRNRGVVLELSQEGLSEISNFGMRDFFRDNLAENELVIGSYDDYHDQYIVTMREPFVNPADDVQNVPLILSRQGFLSRNDACRFPKSKLQNRLVYEFWSENEIQGFQVGDIIYQDRERTSIVNGSDNWFVSTKDTSDIIVASTVVQDNQVRYNISNRIFDDEILVGQKLTLESILDPTRTYEGEIATVTSTDLSIQLDEGEVLNVADDVIGAEFNLIIEFEYIININSFGVVSRVLNCIGVPPLNHDAFRSSLVGYSSAAEACGSGIIGRILYHNGDDVSPDEGDSIYDTPYGDDEFIDTFLVWRQDFTYEINTKVVWEDQVWQARVNVIPGVEPSLDNDVQWLLTTDPAIYTRGRTQRRGWYKIFDGVDFEDYVIRILRGRIIRKRLCAEIMAGRTSVLHGSQTPRAATETDDAFAARICRTIPANQAFHNGDALLPSVGDVMYINNFTADTFIAGNYSITGGSYIIIVGTEGVISEIVSCVIRECLLDVAHTYGANIGILDAQRKTHIVGDVDDNTRGDRFVFLGQIDEVIFGDTTRQAVNQVTIRWSASGAERYPANPNDFYELDLPNGLIQNDPIILTNAQFLRDSAGEVELEFNIFEFCHNKTLVPQNIRPWHAQLDPSEVIPGPYPGVDPAPFLARIFDLDGNFGTGTIAVQDEVFYDRTAIQRRYFLDESFTIFDGTNGVTDLTMLDSVGTGDNIRYGLWWAFGPFDNMAATEGLLIDNMGYVLAERPREYPFEIMLKYNVNTLLAACVEDDSTFTSFLADNNDFTMTTDFVNDDPTRSTPPSGFYVWQGGTEQIGRLWDSGTKTFTAIDGLLTVDVCPQRLSPTTVLRYTSERNMACFSGGISTVIYLGLGDTFAAGGNKNIFDDEFGVTVTSHSFLRSGSTRLLYDRIAETLTNSTDSCPMPTCTDSSANNQGDPLPCQYNPYCGDSNANNFVASPGNRPRNDTATCLYTQYTASLAVGGTISGPAAGYTITQRVTSTANNGQGWSLNWSFALNSLYRFVSGSSQPAAYSESGIFAGSNVNEIISRTTAVELIPVDTSIEACDNTTASNYGGTDSDGSVTCVFSQNYFFASSDTDACLLDEGGGTTNATIFSDGSGTFYASNPDVGTEPSGFASAGWYTATAATGSSVFRLGTDGTVAATAICVDPALPITNVSIGGLPSRIIAAINNDATISWTGGTAPYTLDMSSTSGQVSFGAFETGTLQITGITGTSQAITFHGAVGERTYPMTATVTDSDGESRARTINFTTEVEA